MVHRLDSSLRALPRRRCKLLPKPYRGAVPQTKGLQNPKENCHNRNDVDDRLKCRWHWNDRVHQVKNRADDNKQNEQ